MKRRYEERGGERKEEREERIKGEERKDGERGGEERTKDRRREERKGTSRGEGAVSKPVQNISRDHHYSAHQKDYKVTVIFPSSTFLSYINVSD